MGGKTKKLAGITGITLAVYLGMRYLLPIVAPFFIAYLFVRWIYPLANKIEGKIRLKKEIVTLIFLILGTVAAGIALWFLGIKLCEQIRGAVERLEYYRESLDGMLDGCCLAVERAFGIDGKDVRNFLEQNINTAAERIQVYLVPNLFQHSVEYAMGILKVCGVFFIVFIAVILLMKDYDAIHEKLEGFRGYQKVVHITDRLWGLGGEYLKAQGIIMLVVMTICVLGLWILGNPYALLVGIVIGLLDVLPFIGTGTIFIPWALLSLARGRFFYAAAYFTLFLVANTAREYLEPKLLGARIGVYPIVIAVVVYAGLRIYGIPGVILGPLTLLTVIECYRELFQ